MSLEFSLLMNLIQVFHTTLYTTVCVTVQMPKKQKIFVTALEKENTQLDPLGAQLLQKKKKKPGEITTVKYPPHTHKIQLLCRSSFMHIRTALCHPGTRTERTERRLRACRSGKTPEASRSSDGSLLTHLRWADRSSSSNSKQVLISR